MARRFAKENGKRYEDLNLIVIHMGGGVSVGAHNHGKVVDVNNILDGEGCFSPERSGTVPVGDLVKMCFSGKYTQQEIYKKICGNGGFNGYLHTNDARQVNKMADEGNAEAKLVWDAFFYQIAKDAGAMAAVLCGQVDQIILTGGIAYNDYTREILQKYLGFIAPITVYPARTSCWRSARAPCAWSTAKRKPRNIDGPGRALSPAVYRINIPRQSRGFFTDGRSPGILAHASRRVGTVCQPREFVTYRP